MKVTNFDLPVMRSWIQENGLRLDTNPYLSGALEAKALLRRIKSPTEPLREVTKEIIHAGRSARIYVDDPEYGIPFLGSTDILAADLSNLPLISKKQVEDHPSFLIREGWTLITRSGTVGRMAYARLNMDGLACSEHVMRVVPDPDKIPPGYLYAFLSSKFGVPMVVGGTYGAIIQHIEPSHIRELPIPRLNDLELEVHNLVTTASNERSRSAELLHQAQLLVRNTFGFEDLSKASTCTNFAVFTIHSNQLERLDAAHFSPVCLKATLELQSACEATKALDETANVFTPGIFKRQHVDDSDYGYPYFSGSELFQYNPQPRGFLSRTAPNIKDYIVYKDWLVIQDAGQLDGLIGRITRIGAHVDGSVISNHLMRIAPKSRIDAAYLFAILSSPHGYRAITRYAFGTSIPQLDPKHIARLKIPWPDSPIRAQLASPILESWELEDHAIASEGKAISLVEKCIEGVE